MDEEEEIQKKDLPKITNEKHKLFIKKYVISFNATKAAISAGYSKDSARSQGCKLLAEGSISQHIHYILQESHKKLDISNERILREVAGVGFSRVTDFVDMIGEKEAESLNPEDFDDFEEYKEKYRELKSKIAMKPLSEMGDSIAAIEEININRGEIKTKGKMKALELLGKHRGLWDHEQDTDKRDRGSNLDRIRSAIRITRDRSRERGESDGIEPDSGQS